MSGKGSIRCSPSLTLSSVLHVPDFSTNLLSISSLTKALNCKVTFYPSYCVFQELETGKTIGYGRVHDGLYLLEAGLAHLSGDLSSSQAHQADSATSAYLQLLQWHRRLGHPSIGVLEKILF